MPLDERTEQAYAALDDNGLLSLLLVLRQEQDRHLKLSSSWPAPTARP